MPFALSIGVPYETFMHLVPNQLRAYYKAYKLKKEMRDEEAWMWWGNYGISALIFAIDHCFGDNPKSEYIKKPIMLDMDKKENGMSEEELQRQRELFVAKLQVMQTNFELSNKGQ